MTNPIISKYVMIMTRIRPVQCRSELNFQTGQGFQYICKEKIFRFLHIKFESFAIKNLTIQVPFKVNFLILKCGDQKLKPIKLQLCEKLSYFSQKRGDRPVCPTLATLLGPLMRQSHLEEQFFQMVLELTDNKTISFHLYLQI